MGFVTRQRLRPILAGCVLAALAAVAASSAPLVATLPGVRVVIPAGPGQAAKVGTSDTVPAPAPETYSATDVWFVRMMIPHHAQAVQMAALAAQRAHNPQIAAIAGRMKAAQEPEIVALRAWLRARGLKEEEGGHSHATMPGMQTPEAMQALTQASGEQFDRMFVAMMSAHHRGAIEMAGLRLRAEGDLMVEKMANAIAFEQSVEIGRMGDILGA